MPNFLDYIRENSTLDLSGDVDKNLSVGDVHVPAAGGDGGKKKKKKPEPPVSVAYNAKSFDHRMKIDRVKEKVTEGAAWAEAIAAVDKEDKEFMARRFGEDNTGNAAVDYFNSEMAKLKLKQKVSVECDPDELKALLSSHPEIAALFTRMIGKAGKTATRTILLMRHGATHLNDDDTSVDRIRGWKNVPLSEEGKEEAARLAEKIAKDPPEHLVSSDLKRAADTAKMVAAASDLKMSKGDFREGLRPWNVGRFAGQPSKKAVPILCDYAINKPDETVPEGESFNEFYARFTGELAKALKDYPDGALGVVSHHRNERVLKASEKAGWKPGKIDGKEFSKKGEGTAGFELIDIPQSWLDGVADGGSVAKWENTDFDISKIWQDSQGITTDFGNDHYGDGEEDDPALYRRDKPVDKSFALTVCKVDAEQQIFYGWAYVSEENGQIVVDKQDDYILPGDLLKAAEDFTLHGGKLGDMHDSRNVGRVVASFVTSAELCKAFGLTVADDRRGWILGFKVDDPAVWAKIKSGDQIELSIGGRGERVEWETADGQPHVRAQ